jgi:acyl dehydratase
MALLRFAAPPSGVVSSAARTEEAATMTRPTRWFEDLHPGEVAEFGDYAMTASEVVEFATRFDPQPFHTDPVAARDSIFGGLVASGWHTGSAVMRMLVDHYVTPESSMGSPGLDEIRWLKPVRPGDRLRVRVTVLEAIPSRSKPDRGVIRSLTEAINQDGEVVMTMRGMNMIRRRPVGA